MPNTVQLHRILRASPKVVFRAFTDADALAKWLPPPGYTGRVHEFNPRPGGTYAMSFTDFATGDTHAWHGTFAEWVPDERLVIKDRFDDPALPGEMTKTITLRPASCGTDLHIVHEGLPDSIPPDGCSVGWQDCLAALATLVEIKASD